MLKKIDIPLTFAILVVAVVVAASTFYGRPLANASTRTITKEEADQLFGLSAADWTAIFTALLTVSTIGLWTVTLSAARASAKAANAAVSQAKITGDTLKLAGEEYLSTHRPRIIVHVIQFMEDYASSGSDDPNIGARIFFFNNGTSEATVIEKYVKITMRRVPWVPTALPEIAPVEPYTIGVGMKDYVEAFSDFRLSQAAVLMRGDPTTGLFCVGMITYKDGLGNRRETAFCRVFDPYSQRWEAGKVPEYEYQY